MDHDTALAALRLLTRLFEASRALLELLRKQREGDDGSGGRHIRPRHLKK